MAGDNITLAQNTMADGEAAAPEAGLGGELGGKLGGELGVESGAVPGAEPGLAPEGDLNGDMLFDTGPVEPATTSAGGDTEVVENPYGLEQLWAQGDFVAKGTLIILVLMSLYSWFIILTKLWEQARLLKQARQASRDFWTGSSLSDGMTKLTGKGNSFRAIVESGIKATDHHEGRLTDVVPLAEWITGTMQRNVERVNNDLQRGLSFLASVGSTAPFVGLFGTVWGIYHALIAIGIAGQASIDKVAGPVGEALIMTAIGLAVAVPAVLGYNWLLRRNKAIMDQVRYFTNDVYATLVSGGNKPQTGAK
jgi:biopolymer transport protein ExbB